MISTLTQKQSRVIETFREWGMSNKGIVAQHELVKHLPEYPLRELSSYELFMALHTGYTTLA
ncbi:hypothetical protein [Robertmurraya sp. Marseille-Q9965]